MTTPISGPGRALALGLALLVPACASDSPTSPPELGGASLEVAATSISVVMSGLDAPRGMAWGPEGGLYVAEAGTGTVNGPCAITPRGPNCYSGTGAVSRLWKGKQERVASGLPSLFNTGEGTIGGPQDIGFQGRGNAKVTVGWGADPALRAELGEFAEGFGSLLQLNPAGGWKVVADVSAFETANNPAGGPFDSNPYGLLVEPGRTFITDAGANALLEVKANGDVSLVSVFAPIPVDPNFGWFSPVTDPVPTEVLRNPDGTFEVSLLSGAPFLPGAASVMRVMSGQAPVVDEGGFAMITDIDRGPDGSLYVLQYASAPFFGGPGQLIRIAPDGSRTVLTTALNQAAGVLAGPDGAVYVSQNGNMAGAGEVLRIVP